MKVMEEFNSNPNQAQLLVVDPAVCRLSQLPLRATQQPDDHSFGRKTASMTNLS